MIIKWQRIGGYLTRFLIDNAEADRIVELTIGKHWITPSPEAIADYEVSVYDGYGAPYLGVEPVQVKREADGGTSVTRTDFQVVASEDLSRMTIRFYDYFGLRTGLLNWYSRALSRRDWGVIIHSSCIVHQGAAYLFAGFSGAGKTTIASMSRPRPILADETSIVEIAEEGGVLVHDSPFRNDFKEPSGTNPVPLRGIYLIKQSLEVRNLPIRKSEALIALMNKIVHWQDDPAETTRLIQRCKKLVERVPVYELHFQKNDSFWEAIS